MNVTEDAICPTCGQPSQWNHPSVFKDSGVEHPWPKGRYAPAGPVYCSMVGQATRYETFDGVKLSALRLVNP